MKIILDFNRTLFNPDTDTLYPGVLGLLKQLAAKNDLFLITRNELQRKDRLADLGIAPYFTKTFFVEEKTPDLFADIAGRDKNVFVVGDNIQDEIRIGNTLGLKTVRVLQSRFKTLRARTAEELAHFNIESIGHLGNIVQVYGK
jgi:phosphoglycolate phosphatase-like HAD superfamily hydrolase